MENGGIEASLEELLKDCTPCIDMEFDSEDAAYRFYSEYGRIVGFCVRKDYSKKSKKDGVTIHRKFVCSKEGKKEQNNTIVLPRRETRTGCKAFMYASLDRASLKWYVKKFDATHNHLLHIPETVHMMRNQRGLTESQGISAEIAEATGLPLKLSHDLMSAQSGGREFTGFLREDLKSHLRSKRQRDLEYGEAKLLLRYFEKQTIDNPYFFRSIQLDVDEMITNVFWADHQMIADYGLFGDVLSFDTTFRTNKECRPLAIFTGFNHFRVTVIFGVALMYDETTPSFVWLFETFLRAMSGKKPFTFFTDQDQAMANVISQVMPDVKHGLCTFHLNQNAMKHLGYLYGPDSTFSEDLNLCMFGYEEEDELDEAWKCLVKNFNLEGNAWIDKTWTLREKWVHVHMKWSFNIGMRSTQLSESLNAKLKKHLKSSLNLGQFFTQLDQVIFDKRYIEKEATHDSREKMVRIKFPHCPMLLHVAKLYTPPLFDLFHKQFDISLGCKVLNNKIEELGDEIKFVVQKHKSEREYVVLGHVELDASGAKTLGGVSCSCRKFESYGILCGHAIKVLSHMNVMEIPEKYILGRWRLDAKSCSSMGKEVMVEENDRKLLIAVRYRHLCPRLVTLAAQVCEHDEAYKLVEDTTTSLYAKVDAIMLPKHGDGASSREPNIDMGLHSIDPNLKGAKGLKRKPTNRASKGGNKRLKAWHEKLRKKAKPSQDIQQSGTEILLQSPSSNQPMDGETPYYPQTTHLLCQPSCSAPVSEEMTFDRARHSSIHIPTEAKQFFHDDEFIDFCVNSQPPSQH